MNDMIQTGFDYTALPVDLAISLKLHEDRFIAVRNRATYEMGKEIYEAQQELANNKNGCFQAWVEHLGISYQTGYDLITIYQNAGSDIIKLFDNKKLSQTVAVMLLRAPESVAEKAIEKAESGEKVTVADVKDWKAELEAERKAREDAERRSVEWREQDKANRKKIEALELDLLTVKSQPAPKPEVKEVIPADYETAKAEAARLQTELANLKKEQDRLVNAQLKAKLNERARELEEMERRKTLLEEQVARMTAYMASLDSEADRIEVHRSVIEKSRLSLIDLAAFLGDSDPISDAETLKRWRALAAMLGDAIAAIHHFAGGASPALAVIRGEAA